MKRRKWNAIGAVIMTAALTTGVFAGCGKNQTYEAELPTEAEESEIYVEPIDGISGDFIKGMDVSSLIAEEESGVVYYDEDGNEADLCKVLADAGVNYIRVRVWNDPYDSDGNGYGGGNNDVEKAAEIGKRAAAYGIKLAVDFHYSDFWADPSKQFAPKEWAHLTFADKKEALYQYTKESLKTISDAGAQIGMVQIGNEINNGMAGESNEEKVIELLQEGSKAVREFSDETKQEIKITVHYTNVEDSDSIMAHAKALADAGLDYDVFGISYYSYWHGTMENMQQVLSDIASDYGKETCIMETSYAYTLDDGDGNGNSIGEEKDLCDGYAATVQSQANNLRDIMAAASDASALGVFYWEGAWIPVGANDQKTANAKLWEKYGSGWASSYAAKYDPNDAGKYYGGCAWENQALFDFNGHPLPSLNVFKYVNYGTICEPAVDYLAETKVEVNVGESLAMPETVYAYYNDRSKSSEVPVTWDEEQVAAIDTGENGTYTVDGILEDGKEVTATVKVAQLNYVDNPGFEEKNTSMWQVAYEGEKNPTDVQDKESDALNGTKSFHFWDESDFAFSVEQTISDLPEGTYTLNANIQGGDVGKNAEIYLYAVVDGTTYQSEPVTLSGWVNWQTPEIKDIPVTADSSVVVGMYVKSAAGGWGTMDDFYLYKQ